MPAPAAPVTTPAKSPESRIRSFEVVDGRVNLSLGWPELTVLGAVLLALLWGSFQAGRRSATPSAPEDPNIAALLDAEIHRGAQQQPAQAAPAQAQPARPVATPPAQSNDTARQPEPARATPPPQSVTAPPEPQLIAGRYYVHVQYFPTRRVNHANAARDFLTGKGVECAVVRRSADLALIATQAFESSPAADRLKQQIRGLGREYAREGGGYDFGGCEAYKQ